MSLEQRIKAYGEQARAELINRYAKTKEKAKQGKAEWIGYDNKGNGLVRQDGKVKVVKVIGSISLPVGSSVMIDENNTIEIRKAKLPQPKPKTVPARKGPGGYKSKSRPLIITDDGGDGFLRPILYLFGPLAEWVEYSWQGALYRFPLQPILSEAVGGQAMTGEYTVFSRYNILSDAYMEQRGDETWYYPNPVNYYRWDGLKVQPPRLVVADGPVFYLTVEYKASHDGPVNLIVDSFTNIGSSYQYYTHEIQRSNYTRGFLTLAFNTETQSLTATSSNYFKKTYFQLPSGEPNSNQETQGYVNTIIQTHQAALKGSIPSSHPFFDLPLSAFTTTSPFGWPKNTYLQAIEPPGTEYSGFPFTLSGGGFPHFQYARSSFSMSPDRKFAISAVGVDAQAPNTGYSVIQSYNASSYIESGAYLAPLRLVLPSYVGNGEDLYEPGTNGEIMDTEYVSADIISALNGAPYSVSDILQSSSEPAAYTIQFNIVQRSLIFNTYPLLSVPYTILYPSYPPQSTAAPGYITDWPSWVSIYYGGFAYVIANDNYPTS